jgi:uncharacterized protein YggE
MSRSIVAALAVIGAVAFVALGASALRGPGSTTTTIQSETTGSTHGISVSGEGKVTGKPDLAQLRLGVSVLRPTVAAARDQAANSLSAITSALKADGVADKDIQTQQLTISPEYDYSGSKQRLTGFRVTNVVSAKVRTIDTTSKVVDDAVNAAGDDVQIEGITFTIDKPDDLKQQARALAVADAKSKAQTLASASGVSLGSAVDISEGGGVQPVVFSGAQFDAARAAGASAPTPVQPGELDVTVNVNITWAIK